MLFRERGSVLRFPAEGKARAGGGVHGAVLQAGMDAVAFGYGMITVAAEFHIVAAEVLALLTDVVLVWALVLFHNRITSLHHYTSLDAKCNPLFFEVTIYTLYNIK